MFVKIYVQNFFSNFVKIIDNFIILKIFYFKQMCSKNLKKKFVENFFANKYLTTTKF